MGILYLIGTNHVDPLGSQRLESIFDELDPDIILAEGNPDLHQRLVAFQQRFNATLVEEFKSKGYPKKIIRAAKKNFDDCQLYEIPACVQFWGGRFWAGLLG